MAKEVEKQKIYTIQLANVMEITSSSFLSYGSLIVFTRYCIFIFQCSLNTRRVLLSKKSIKIKIVKLKLVYL